MLRPSTSPSPSPTQEESPCVDITISMTTLNNNTLKRLLPSELKKIQSRKIKETTSCFTSLPPNTTALIRKPLQSLSINTISTTPSPSLQILNTNRTSSSPPAPPVSPEQPLVLPNSLISEFSLSFTIPQTSNLQDINEFITNNLKSKSYYQYPFPEFPLDSSKSLSNSLQKHRQNTPKTTKFGTNSSAKKKFSETEYFLTIIKGWRRSLLSCYQEWKEGRMDHFYFFQPIPDISIIFRSNFQVLIPSSSKSLRDSLKKEGISYDYHSLTTFDDVMMGDDNDDDNDDNDDDDDTFITNANKKGKIRRLVDERLNKEKMTKSLLNQNQKRTIIISGSLMVHQLIDYLLMQEDLRSTIILPQIVAPCPFLHGTMLKTEISFSTKALIDGNYSLKIAPSPLSSFFPPLSFHSSLKLLIDEFKILIRGHHFVAFEKMSFLNNKNIW